MSKTPQLNADSSNLASMVVDVEHGVVRASGELDIGGAPAMRNALRQVCVEHAEVVIDMAGVTFMDSTGLRELLRATSDGHRVVLRRVPEQVRALLSMAGVEPLFSFEG
ncbi:MAG TPA: STAS domain-containing protein [Microthrixaceae bacterium]|nr:STAS domain-containing protein [Microthrixaceae bacterium]